MGKKWRRSLQPAGATQFRKPAPKNNARLIAGVFVLGAPGYGSGTGIRRSPLVCFGQVDLGIRKAERKHYFGGGVIDSTRHQFFSLIDEFDATQQVA
jgi:hypothetical protein